MAGRPGPHPLPPGNLANQDLPIDVLEQAWFRFHRVRRAALYWGVNPRRPQPARWDAPDGEYGVLYVSADERGAFVETFGHRTGIKLIQQSDLASRCLSTITFDRPLRLVKVAGPRLAHLGADARLFAGDYEVAQQWSHAFFQHPSAPDGILYPSRHDETRLCAAIFDRPTFGVTETRVGTLADPEHARLLGALLDVYGFGLLTP